ncbi:MAG: hemolysin family protein [Candidatus Latescibacterota bacterium]|nr:hemolysin family protein [Candidatus Latescibacterota bacterium]
MTELIIAVSAAVGISAMCSLFEAVLYSTPIGHLESLAESGSPTGRIMRSLRSNVDRPIAAILSLNTIANTAGAAVAGAAAAQVFGDANVGYFSAFFTLAILMFSEVIPKTTGVVYNRVLVKPVARPLQLMVWVFSPLIWFTGAVTRLIARGRTQEDVSQDELLTMARLSRESGVIESSEAMVIENILSLEGKAVNEIMTPRTVVFSMAASMKVEEVRDRIHVLNHSRIPIYDKDADDVVGMVLRHELLTALAEGKGEQRLDQIMRPVDFVAATLSADRLLRRLLERREHMVLVVDEFGGLSGLVTLEDVLEEILGTEIVDEFDTATDMRELAHRRRLTLGDEGARSS